MAGVVVGVSGSAASSRAVRWASGESVVRNQPLTVVHVWRCPLQLDVDLEPGALPEAPGPVTSRALHGPVADALAGQDPDLLVLGVPERSRHLGRLPRTVLHRARCPVVLVPARSATRHRVVVGLCGTPAATGALRWAAREAAVRDVELMVVSAWQPLPASGRDLLHPVRDARAHLATALAGLFAQVCGVLSREQITVVMTRGPQLEALLEASAQADLLVVGRGDHTRLHRLVHGVLVHDLAALASCPIAVIPIDHRQPAGPQAVPRATG